MQRQGHILSFDEAKRASSARPSARRPYRGAADRPFRDVDDLPVSRDGRRAASPLLSYLSDSSFESPYAGEDLRREAARARAARLAFAAAADPVPRRGREAGAVRRGAPVSGSESPRSRAESRLERPGVADADAFEVRSGRGSRLRRSAAAGDAASSSVRGERSSRLSPASKEPARASFSDRMRERRHARLKERADREFDKRFGGDDAAASDAGPRAAVTKGAMGARQRRASRLQDGAAGSSKHGAGALSSSGSLPSRLWRAVRTSPRFAACSIVTLGLAVSLAYLYPTAQTYYCAMRQHDKLEVEYAALADRNALLQTDVDSLNTDAGIERHAQEQLGWVKQGEQTANVKGLTLEEDPSEELAVYANVVSSDVSAPTTWYSPVCDALFGFK